MSGRTADWLTETIELLLGTIAVVFMFPPLTLQPLQPMFGGQEPELVGTPLALYLLVVPRLVALVALGRMIWIYVGPRDEPQ